MHAFYVYRKFTKKPSHKMGSQPTNHLIELAMAGGAAAIITHNVRDIRRGELLLNGLRVHTPAEYLEETR
jgi:hypothetical protein